MGNKDIKTVHQRIKLGSAVLLFPIFSSKPLFLVQKYNHDQVAKNQLTNKVTACQTINLVKLSITAPNNNYVKIRVPPKKTSTVD